MGWPIMEFYLNPNRLGFRLVNMVNQTLLSGASVINQEESLQGDDIARSPLTVGEFAYQLIADQFRHMVKQEEGVLADQEPESLHHMRVSSRRLRTALQVFGAIADLPKAAGGRQVQLLTRTLGQLRDLDVQLYALQNDYAELLTSKSEQKVLKKTIKALKQRRKHALKQVKHYLTRSSYCKLKAAYEKWLNNPRYTTLAQLPLPMQGWELTRHRYLDAEFRQHLQVRILDPIKPNLA
jgi:CHAD domain-containing protein